MNGSNTKRLLPRWLCTLATAGLFVGLAHGLAPATHAADPEDDVVCTTLNTPVTIDVLANDLDNLDAVFANAPDLDDQVNRVCFGRGDGTFYACDEVDPRLSNESAGVALGDLDRDGDLDAVFANAQMSADRAWQNQVCVGNGDGTFDPCTVVDQDQSYYSLAVTLKDLNGDHGLDAVFAAESTASPPVGPTENRVCLRNEDGTFVCKVVDPSQANRSFDVALGHLNGDTYLDAVFANYPWEGNPTVPGINQVCMGNRDGTFDPCTPVDEQSSRSRGIALGDMNDNVDDNHNLDAVFANVGQYNQVCLGNGQGAFTNCVVVAGGADSLDVALSDLDRDGHLDAVFANTISNEVCLGDGDGTFAECAVLEPAISGNWGVALGDLDNDQNLDVVFANQ